MPRPQDQIFGTAVDYPNPNWSWSTGGIKCTESRWRVSYKTYLTGGMAAESGKVKQYGKTWLEASLVGVGMLKFWWKVSSPPASYGDHLIFSIGNKAMACLDGETDWKQESFYLPDKPQTDPFNPVTGKDHHILKWSYEKTTPAFHLSQDKGWVDKVQFFPSATMKPLDTQSRTVPSATLGSNTRWRGKIRKRK